MNRKRLGTFTIAALLVLASISRAQPVADTPAAAPRVAPPPTLESLAWLAGCWRGVAGGREFREQWTPADEAGMKGESRTVEAAKTVSFEALRLASRPEGLFYVAVESGRPESAFRLSGVSIDNGATVFAFVAIDAASFPQRILYRRVSNAALFIHVEGLVAGAERNLIYPMRRVDCESGEPGAD